MTKDAVSELPRQDALQAFLGHSFHPVLFPGRRPWLSLSRSQRLHSRDLCHKIWADGLGHSGIWPLWQNVPAYGSHSRVVGGMSKTHGMRRRLPENPISIFTQANSTAGDVSQPSVKQWPLPSLGAKPLARALLRTPAPLDQAPHQHTGVRILLG